MKTKNVYKYKVKRSVDYNFALYSILFVLLLVTMIINSCNQ
ncbi:hypothetical protein [Pedobacter sp. BS3]|nr:hypothetical protein [Pedobacter sp. BS3]